MELPPAGGPGRAEPRALRRRQDPASARPVSRGPWRAGGRAGLSGSAWSAIPGAASGPALPAGPPPLPGPAAGRGEGRVPENQPCAVASRPPRRPAGAEDLAHSTAWGSTALGVRAASGPPPPPPPFQSLWPRRAGTYRGNRVSRPRTPLPLQRSSCTPKDLLKAAVSSPPTMYVPWAVRFPPGRAGGGQTSLRLAGGPGPVPSWAVGN